MIDFEKYYFGEHAVKYDGVKLTKRDLSSHIRHAYNVHCELRCDYFPKVLPSDIYYNIMLYKFLACSFKFYVSYILNNSYCD